MAAKWNQISSANSCCSCKGEILFSQTNKCKSCGKLSSWNSNQTRFECGHFCSNAKGKYIHPCIVINFVNNCIVKWRLGAWDILELPLFAASSKMEITLIWSDIWNVSYIELRILKSSELWWSQLWMQCLNCIHNCDDHSSLGYTDSWQNLTTQP